MKGSPVRVRASALADYQGKRVRPAALLLPLCVHFASIGSTRGTNLILGSDLCSVPVLYHAGVVLLDHRHAGPALLRDRSQRDAGVNLDRDKARAQVAGPRPFWRDTGIGSLPVR